MITGRKSGVAAPALCKGGLAEPFNSFRETSGEGSPHSGAAGDRNSGRFGGFAGDGHEDGSCVGDCW